MASDNAYNRHTNDAEPTLGATILQARSRLGWTQSQLAEKVGVTPSFITKLEKDEALPSYDRTVALANVLVLDAKNLLSLIEQNKEDRGLQRIRTRGASLRNAYGISPSGDNVAPSSAENSSSDMAAQFGREILENPDLQVALTFLRTALADPDTRSAALTTLEAPKPHEQPP